VGVIIMKYADGKDARLGDQVQLWEGERGKVVCTLDTNEYAEAFPPERWQHLRKGLVVAAERAGLLYYALPDEDMKLLARQRA
jgi:hypothetical protein